MSEAMDFGAVLFDAYGTLFNLAALAEPAERRFPGLGETIALAWRRKQIEYTLLRTAGGRYADFLQVTRDALDFTLAQANLACDAAIQTEILDGFLRLPLHPEAKAALGALRRSGRTLAILSNGTPQMLADNLVHAGVADLFDHVLSVHAAGRFKTAPEAYRLGVEALRLPPSQVLFVSSNGWDAAGATWFGYTTFWINRLDAPVERLAAEPHKTGRSLDDLVAYLC